MHSRSPYWEISMMHNKSLRGRTESSPRVYSPSKFPRPFSKFSAKALDEKPSEKPSVPRIATNSAQHGTFGCCPSASRFRFFDFRFPLCDLPSSTLHPLFSIPVGCGCPSSPLPLLPHVKKSENPSLAPLPFSRLCVNSRLENQNSKFKNEQPFVTFVSGCRVYEVPIRSGLKT